MQMRRVGIWPRWSLLLWLAAFQVSVSVAAPPQAAIASAHPLATQAGFEILERGGNAFDAAVAVSAALAVVEPYSSGIGGGGFWLLHRAGDGKQTMIDGRERAPFTANRDLFLNPAGEFEQQRSINGPLSAGIPGMPAALAYLAEHYGKLPLSTCLEPAIRHAREGFIVGDEYLRMMRFRAEAMQEFEAAAAIFIPTEDAAKKAFRLVQKDLAKTLQALATDGRAGFYSGPIGQALVRGVRKAGGIWSNLDLERYRVVEREPIHADYQGIRITSAAPPSSGGIVMTEALNILAGFDLTRLNRVDRKHLIVEAMRRAYRDRARYLGDPDYITMPIERLTSRPYAASLRAGIRLQQAGFPPDPSSTSKRPQRSQETEGRDTTHFSIIDRQGNRVAATLSINYPFGSCFVPAGTGVLLNDEMDDFVSHSSSANIYGLVGGEANSIQPGKRMLSSMTPTFLEDRQRVAVLGTPGGSRIISMVLLAALDFADGNGAESWVAVPRYHHQYLPDKIQYEPGGLTDLEIQFLRGKGHQFRELSRRYGNMQAVLWDKRANKVTAASDPRRKGLATVR